MSLTTWKKNIFLMLLTTCHMQHCKPVKMVTADSFNAFHMFLFSAYSRMAGCSSPVLFLHQIRIKLIFPGNKGISVSLLHLPIKINYLSPCMSKTTERTLLLLCQFSSFKVLCSWWCTVTVRVVSSWWAWIKSTSKSSRGSQVGWFG